MTKKNYVSTTTFRRWVERMVREYENNSDAVSSFIGDTTYVYLKSQVGKSKRNENDTNDYDIAIAYAWARCTGQQECYDEKDKPKDKTKIPFISGDYVNVTFANGRIFLLKFVAEGVDNYCFRQLDGHLETYYKNCIKDITFVK